MAEKPNTAKNNDLSNPITIYFGELAQSHCIEIGNHYDFGDGHLKRRDRTVKHFAKKPRVKAILLSNGGVISTVTLKLKRVQRIYISELIIAGVRPVVCPEARNHLVYGRSDHALS